MRPHILVLSIAVLAACGDEPQPADAPRVGEQAELEPVEGDEPYAGVAVDVDESLDDVEAWAERFRVRGYDLEAETEQELQRLDARAAEARRDLEQLGERGEQATDEAVRELRREVEEIRREMERIEARARAGAAQGQ